VAPAIDAALVKVNADSLGGTSSQWTHPGFNLNVSYADSLCDIAESLNHAIQFYMAGQVRSTPPPRATYILFSQHIFSSE